MTRYRIKLAESAEEREAIHRLNYETFVEEIPQHQPNTTLRLVDQFDAENEYAIALTELGELAGMLAVRAQRPFSLDRKLERLDGYLPPHRSVCEIRLLALKRGHRRGTLFRDLVAFMARRVIELGHDLAVISGVTRQLPLYRHLGFEPFGPLVGAPGAQFQPMYLSLEGLQANAGNVLQVAGGARRPDATACFSTGPVTISGSVRAAMGQPPVPHRADDFVSRLAKVRRSLCALTGAGDAALLVGSGTLANDVVALALGSLSGRGLVLANGEFGERLIEQARCAGLSFEALRMAWGEPLREEAVNSALAKCHADWIWAVHCETSTGVLNDLDSLRRWARAAGAVLCVDSVSSIGTVALDLDGIWLASASSGKGLAAYAGLAAILVNGKVPARAPRAPRYLDLAHWLENDSVPFTHSSNLVAALEASLAGVDWEARFGNTAHDASWLRSALRARGLSLVAPEEISSPGVVSIALDDAVRSSDVAAALAARGFELGWRSSYLASRNWIQVALMGEYDRAALRRLPDAIAQEVLERTRLGVRAA